MVNQNAIHEGSINWGKRYGDNPPPHFTCPILGVPINTGPCSSVVKPMVFIFLPILVD